MKFTKDYFIGGTLSNYADYRKKKFKIQAKEIEHAFRLRKEDKILDYGCATAGLLKELKRNGFWNLKGTDISDWAIDYSKKHCPSVKTYHYNRDLLTEKNDVIIALDVLEHCSDDELKRILNMFHKYPPYKGILVRTPVSAKEGEDFILEVSKRDKTHIQIHSKVWWLALFKDAGYYFNPVNMSTLYDTPGVLVGLFIK